jgi:D-glycero-alpha-D-manno-heptose-7-phosphate kinase
MIICRTPYRISFFGGGTDYPVWYQDQGGAVLSTTINHYCYLHCRILPPFFKHKSRVVWSKVEEVLDHELIEHPPVRAILNYLNIKEGIEIHHTGDLPARSGIGSSSAFTVGLLNAFYALSGYQLNKNDLARKAIHIEHHVLKENVGIQDQIATAFGGFNKISIKPNGDFNVTPMAHLSDRTLKLQNHLLLFFTGISRTASEIAEQKIKSIPGKKYQLLHIHKLVNEAVNVLTQGHDINDFGRLLHETWLLKRQINDQIAPAFINDIYEKARAAGALGGKLLGAGGGGFMVFFVEPEHQQHVCEALKDLLRVPFEFELNGSEIIFNDSLRYRLREMKREEYRHLR